MKMTAGMTMLALSAIFAWAGTAMAAVTNNDTCELGENANDINKVTASYDASSDAIVVEMALCGDSLAPAWQSIYSKTKYRVHFDHTAPFAVDADRDGDGIVDEDDFCATTSDDTMMHRVHKNATKDTGPGIIWVDSNTLTYTVPVVELSFSLGISDTVYIWADTQWKSINDRAPNTESGDGCSKPEVASEALALTLGEGDKIVFVSSQQHNGNFGGLAGADAFCQGLADNATAGPLGGTYKAWLSYGTDAPATRFIRGSPYVLVNGTKVADDWADLTDGSLDNAILRDENNVIHNNQRIWTGTNPTGGTYPGVPSVVNCSGWSTTAAQARTGQNNFTGSGWTSGFNSSCGNFSAHRVYCFQQ